MMKKILSEWKVFLKESTNTEDEKILDKVREMFFGAYNSWDEEYKQLQDEKFKQYYSELVARAREKFGDKDKVEKISRYAAIGLSLYWSDNPQHGAGTPEMLSYVINKKLEILESALSDEEKTTLKNGLMKSIVDNVREDRSNQMFPTTLAVSVGVINGIQVDDAYMTTVAGINRFVIPILSQAGYYADEGEQRPVPPSKTKRKKYEPQMSLDDLKAQMKKFGR